MIDSDTEVGTRREARRWSVVAAASAALLALGLILVVGTSNPADASASKPTAQTTSIQASTTEH